MFLYIYLSLSLSIYIYIYVYIAIRVLCWGDILFQLALSPAARLGQAHTGEDYDALAADAFSVGVMIFTLAHARVLLLLL